jgi:hypothetical protein
VKRMLMVLVLMIVLLFAVGGPAPASAQDSDNDNAPITVNLEGATGTLGIQHEVETQATVELTVGDQLYKLTVPVTVQIDTTKVLTDAQLVAPASQQVGTFLFEPVGVEGLEGDYEKEFRTVSPSSSDNVVVVYRANITNLHDAPLEAAYTSLLKTSAVDDAGNLFEEEERLCDTINPGETLACEFIFDVPATTNLVDLQVETVAYKQFKFPRAAATE